MFKEWTKFELGILIGSILAISLSGFLCKSDVLTIVCAITGIACAITQAKGKIISQFIGLILVVLYSILSYKNNYFGEVLIYIFIMLPLFIIGIISWLKNIDKATNTVKEHKISKREWCILTVVTAIVFTGLYFLLKHFNTSQLLVSTLSMVTSLFATYLIARRSKYGFIFYMLNDIILFLLWGIPVVLGDKVLIPMLINPIVNFINDTYGWKSWNKK